MKKVSIAKEDFLSDLEIAIEIGFFTSNKISTLL